MPLETKPWDPSKRLTSPEAMSAYLQAALEEGDPTIIAAALHDISRAAALRVTPWVADAANPRALETNGLAPLSPIMTGTTNSKRRGE